MKYNDKVTLKLKENHQTRMWEESGKSDRQRRRENKKKYSKFIDEAYKYLNKEWLDSVDEKIKIEICSKWDVVKFRNKYIQHPVDFGDWVKTSFRNIKPNPSIYRDVIINKLLDESDTDN